MENQASDDENNSVNDIGKVWCNRGLRRKLVRRLWEKPKIFADNYHPLFTEFLNILVRNIIKLVPTQFGTNNTQNVANLGDNLRKVR